tara:strand:- start:84 stop:467 length:384 start_codon:yes stop_codon:yes gene_type:complete
MNKNTFWSGLLLVIFFIIRIICKFVVDDDLDSFVIHHTSLDNIGREIIENGLSLSFSFLFVGIIHKYCLKNFTIDRNPYVEFFSILLGTIIMLIINKLYMKFELTKIKIIRKDRDLDKDHVVDLSVN